MIDKIDYKGLMRTIVWNPEAFLYLVFALGSIIWGINEYWKQGRTKWIETNAKLASIQLNERLRNKERELYFKLTFDYNVGSTKYQAYSEELLLKESQQETKTKELKESQDSIKIYYNAENPVEVAFHIQETKPDDGMLYVLIPSMIIMGGLGYWALKFNYKHYFKTGS